MKIDELTTFPLDQIPLVVRLVRRGRPWDEAAAEAGVAETTLRAAEAGRPVSLSTLQALCAWTNCSFVVTPPPLNPDRGITSGDEPANGAPADVNPPETWGEATPSEGDTSDGEGEE